MGDKTGISWTDATWNPVRGCRRKSAGCENCYAEQQAARIVRMAKGKPTKYDGLVKLVNGAPRWTGETSLDSDDLSAPLRWTKPRRIFVDSMSDLFYEGFSNEQIAAVFGVMAAAPQHTFQVLTKRAKRMRKWFAWLDDRIEQVAVDLSGADCAVSMARDWSRLNFVLDAARGLLSDDGPASRACEVEWLRSLRDQCAAAGVAYFLKQAVEPSPHDQPAAMLAGIRHFPPTSTTPDGSKRKGGGVIELPYLDGAQHAAFPA